MVWASCTFSEKNFLSKSENIFMNFASFNWIKEFLDKLKQFLRNFVEVWVFFAFTEYWGVKKFDYFWTNLSISEQIFEQIRVNPNLLKISYLLFLLNDDCQNDFWFLSKFQINFKIMRKLCKLQNKIFPKPRKKNHNRLITHKSICLTDNYSHLITHHILRLLN